MSKYLRFLKLKILGKTVLTTSFINTKPKLRTIQPDVRLSYNRSMNSFNSITDADNRPS